MPNDHLDTTTIVRRAQDGQPAALEELFARYLPRVRRIVAARLCRPLGELHEHEDLVQDSMLDAIRGLAQFEIRSEGAFCHWLATIVANNVRDALRHQRVRQAVARQVVRIGDAPCQSLSDSIFAADQTSPSEALRTRESEAAIERALLRLGDRYREVINLRCFCGMSYREVAAQMGLPSENTANVLFLRARRRLGELLADD